MRLALTIVAAVFATTLLPGCASWQEVPEAKHDPDHKQYVTGSRIAYKGRGGPDAVKTITREGVADQMRARIEAVPKSF